MIYGFDIHHDGLYQSGMTGRDVVYTSRDLRVTYRADLIQPDLATVPLQLGFPGKRKINVLSYYRQWRIQEDINDEAMSEESYENINQAERYGRIVQTWTDMIDEGKETISLSDTNLPTQLMLEDGTSGHYDISHRQISTHFFTRVLPRGVTILNHQPTYFSVVRGPRMIDHAVTTHPMMTSDIQTVNTGDSDHCYLLFTRMTKVPVTRPRYRTMRRYSRIDPL